MDEQHDITPIGITNYRNTNQPFGIKDRDRLQHIYILGKSGSGKTTLLKKMAQSDIERGNSVVVLDPHSDMAKELLSGIPEECKKDVIYFNPKDTTKPIAFNPLKGIHPNYHSLVASSLIATFKKIWSDSWGPRMEHITRYALLTLLTYPDATLLDLQPLLTSEPFRLQVLQFVTEGHVIAFWTGEFSQYTKTLRTEAISPILNKIGLLQASPAIRATIGQKTRGFRMQEILDGKILICNLSKGELGEDVSSLLGCIILTSLQYAAMFRAKQDFLSRKPVYIYADEAQNYMTLSMVDLLSEGRKFGISLTIANQYLGQWDERIRDAIFGNVGTLIAFRVGATDAEYLEKEFYPVFTADDLINLPRFAIYIKLMIDGATSQPFSAKT